ncbi:MAG: hypothetical protein K2J38_03565 [Muribaculaceae bacterium]|nr:hypothetical protein [Muribaculaceae bacterium]
MPCERIPFSREILESSLWNASVQSAVNEGGRGYVSLSPGGFITEYINADSEHYLLSGDTLVFRGYTRGRNIGALVDSVTPLLRFPVVPGDSMTTAYSVSGSVDGVPMFMERGEMSVSAVRRGRFVFASGDTVPAVLVHERRNCLSFTKADSAGVENTEDFWRWYAPDARIPFAIQLTRAGDRAPRLFVPDSYDGAGDDASVSATDEERRREVLAAAQVSYSNGGICVTLGELPGVEADVYIIDVPGNIYGRTVMSLDDTRNEFHIATSGLGHGSYLLVIALGGDSPLVEKRALVL